tara:strand:- start:52 stop:1083 length:1032 start_codon:yes stop_codon:yes gene_type:complete
MILDPTDQTIRNQGFNFVPFNRYLASPFQMPESQTMASPISGTGINTLPMNMGGGGGGTYTGGINDLLTDYDRITKDNYFSNQPTPLVDNLRQSKLDKTFMGFPSYREIDPIGPFTPYSQPMNMSDPGASIENIIASQNVPLELTTAGKIQGGIESFKDKTRSFMDEVGGFGPISFIANALDRFDTLSPADQEFIKMNMGYTGPTVFGDNQSGLSKDPYGINTRSMFGNYADYVDNFVGKYEDMEEEDFNKLSDFRKRKIGFYRQKQKELQQIREQKAKEEAAAEAAQRQATRNLAEQNRREGRGGYQSDFSQDKDFMGGSGTAAEMGSFMDGGIVDLVDIYD